MNHRLTTEEKIALYKKKFQDNKTNKQIARDLGLRDQTINSCLTLLGKALAGSKTKPQYHYGDAVKILNKGVITNNLLLNNATPEFSGEIDPFEELNNGFEKFTQVIGKFTEKMLEKSAKRTIAELERLQKENQELKKAIGEAKVPNWISNLRKTFQGGE